MLTHHFNQSLDSFAEDLLAPRNMTIKLNFGMTFIPGDRIVHHEWNTNGSGRTGQWIEYELVSTSENTIAIYGNVNRIQVGHGNW